MEIMKRLKLEEEGQGLVEYALIGVLISIAAVLLMPGIGERVSEFFTEALAAFDS